MRVDTTRSADRRDRGRDASLPAEASRLVEEQPAGDSRVMTQWLVTVGATFLLAGLVKGVIGLGLPTVAVGLLGLVMAPAQAAAVLVVPSFVTNVWQLAAGPSFGALLRRLWPMMLGILVGTGAGAGLLVADSGRATTALGLALALYGAIGLARFRLSVPRRAEWILSPAVGAVTGFISAVTGVFVIPAVPYLQALGLEKDDLVQALGLSFTVSTVALALLLMHDGAFALPLAGTSLLAVAPALAGMYAGQALRGRVRESIFRIWFFIGLLALGAHLALRPH
jgi:uncharacterized membrane protein YfcA